MIATKKYIRELREKSFVDISKTAEKIILEQHRISGNRSEKSSRIIHSIQGGLSSSLRLNRVKVYITE
jgi:hypothetical protein